jgi:hypothetical protein
MASASSRILLVATFVLALVFGLFVNGALPFLAMPTMGQALWTTGFAQSFVNESLMAVHARNIGGPQPASIAFGLAGAWLTGLFLSIGLAPADAYSAMAAVWLTVAFIGAFGLGRHLGVPAHAAVLGAVAWITMPTIWGHAGYSMVSLGLALLPLYFLTALRLFAPRLAPGSGDSIGPGAVLRLNVAHLLVCLLAVFMDGYSFMMLATGGALLGGWLTLTAPQSRRWLLLVGLPGHALAVGAAYLLYTIYIGKPTFDAAHLDFFRGWGVDLTFLVFPTAGIHWLPDLLGWGEVRTTTRFFGDSSVWRTTYSLPLLIGAAWALTATRQRWPLAAGLLLVSLFGFYMALGPSFKLNSTKPEDTAVGGHMEAQYAVAPTGSGLLSAHLPGFNNMRASYRWQALGAFAAWALLVLALAGRGRITAAALLVAVALMNLPNLPKKLNADMNFRTTFHTIDREFVEPLMDLVARGERVAFLPWHNDFLVNYAAARADVLAYNIGGDKNLEMAREHWPETLSQFPKARVDGDFANRVLLLLTRGEAEVVVLPYIDLLRGAHEWPTRPVFETDLGPAIDQLNRSGYVGVERRPLYAVARLRPEYAAQAGPDLARRVSVDLCLPPECLERRRLERFDHTLVGVLADGALTTAATAGFLHFGPYVPMRAGRYTLVIRGSAQRLDAAWVDVVSGKGTTRHAHHVLGREPVSTGDLLRTSLMLEAAVEDLEIRLHVGADDALTLLGYELRPVEGNRSRSHDPDLGVHPRHADERGLIHVHHLEYERKIAPLVVVHQMRVGTAQGRLH